MTMKHIPSKQRLLINYISPLKGLLLCILVLGCSPSESEKAEKVELEARLQKLEKENQELKETLNQQKSISTPEVKPQTYQQPSNHKYAFVVLTIGETQQEWSQILNRFEDVEHEYYLCSGIQEFLFFDEKSKYWFMDKAQQGHILLRRERIKERQCFTFDNYEEASRKREEYLISK